MYDRRFQSGEGKPLVLFEEKVRGTLDGPSLLLNFAYRSSDA